MFANVTEYTFSTAGLYAKEKSYVDVTGKTIGPNSRVIDMLVKTSWANSFITIRTAVRNVIQSDCS